MDCNPNRDMQIWEIFALNTLGCNKCNWIKCIKSDEQPNKINLIPNVLCIQKPTKMVVIFSPTYSGVVSTGKYHFQHCTQYLPTGIMVFCLCQLNILNNLAQTKLIQENTLHLKASPENQLIPAGVCDKTNSVFLIHLPLASMPTLYTLAQFSIVKTYKTKNNIDNLSNVPKFVLDIFPPIFYASKGFKLKSIENEKHVIFYQSCLPTNHKNHNNLWNTKEKRNTIIF